VIVNTYRLLAQAPSMILTATLDDAAVVEERPNVPGTVEERPNWSIALPVPLEDLEESPTAAAVAEALRRSPRPGMGQGPHALEEPGVGAPGGAAKPPEEGCSGR
jgi:hypothetical protein